MREHCQNRWRCLWPAADRQASTRPVRGRRPRGSIPLSETMLDGSTTVVLNHSGLYFPTSQILVWRWSENVPHTAIMLSDPNREMPRDAPCSGLVVGGLNA